MSDFITNAELRIEAERLCDENVKLRERITSLEAALEGMHLIREQDRAENARLQKLVNDMVNCFKLGARSGEGISRQWCIELFDSYSNKLRELGVEVVE